MGPRLRRDDNEHKMCAYLKYGGGDADPF
jgi:hypothetical protein